MLFRYFWAVPHMSDSYIGTLAVKRELGYNIARVRFFGMYSGGPVH